MKNILSNQIIRKRNSRNAMNLIGHMFSFALDNLLAVFVSLNLHTGQYKLANILVTSAALSNYGINGICQIFLSKRLQVELASLLDSIFLIPFVSKCFSFCRYIGLVRATRLHYFNSIYRSYLASGL